MVGGGPGRPRRPAIGQRLAVVADQRALPERRQHLGRRSAATGEQLDRAPPPVEPCDREPQREARPRLVRGLRVVTGRVGIEQLPGLLLLGGDRLDDGHGDGLVGARRRLVERRRELLQRELADRRVEGQIVRRRALPGATGRRAPVGLQQRLEPPPRVAQLEPHEALAQRLGVRLGHQQRVEVVVDRHVGVDPRQLARDPRVLGVLDQVLLALRAADLVDRREHRLEVAELLEQRRGGLVADPGDAGDVVRGVALEPVEVGDQLRLEPVALDHRGVAVDLGLGDPPRRRHHADDVVGVDQLELVTVAGDDHRPQLALAGVDGQRADHVVGLPALRRDVGVAEAARDLGQERPLLAQQVGLPRALGLVLRIDLGPAGHPGVPDDGGRHRAEVLVELDQHRREAEDRVRRLAGRGRDRFREREERPVRERVPVDQEQVGSAVSHALDDSRRIGPVRGSSARKNSTKRAFVSRRPSGSRASAALRPSGSHRRTVPTSVGGERDVARRTAGEPRPGPRTYIQGWGFPRSTAY